MTTPTQPDTRARLTERWTRLVEMSAEYDRLGDEALREHLRHLAIADNLDNDDLATVVRRYHYHKAHEWAETHARYRRYAAHARHRADDLGATLGGAR